MSQHPSFRSLWARQRPGYDSSLVPEYPLALRLFLKAHSTVHVILSVLNSLITPVQDELDELQCHKAYITSTLRMQAYQVDGTSDDFQRRRKDAISAFPKHLPINRPSNQLMNYCGSMYYRAKPALPMIDQQTLIQYTVHYGDYTALPYRLKTDLVAQKTQPTLLKIGEDVAYVYGNNLSGAIALSCNSYTIILSHYQNEKISRVIHTDTIYPELHHAAGSSRVMVSYPRNCFSMFQALYGSYNGDEQLQSVVTFTAKHHMEQNDSFIYQTDTDMSHFLYSPFKLDAYPGQAPFFYDYHSVDGDIQNTVNLEESITVRLGMIKNDTKILKPIQSFFKSVTNFDQAILDNLPLYDFEAGLSKPILITEGTIPQPYKTITQYPRLSQPEGIVELSTKQPEGLNGCTYTPPYDSVYCLQKCMALWSYRHLTPAVPQQKMDKEYSTVDAWISLGSWVYTMVVSGQRVTDDAFVSAAKKYMIPVRPNFPAAEFSKDYRYMLGEDNREGIYIIDMIETGHAMYQFSKKSIILELPLPAKHTLVCLSDHHYQLNMFLSRYAKNHGTNFAYNYQDNIYSVGQSDFAIVNDGDNFKICPLANKQQVSKPAQVILSEKTSIPDKQRFTNFYIDQSNTVCPPEKTLKMSEIGGRIMKNRFGVDFKTDESLQNKGNYCHPLLRLTVDMFTIMAVSLITTGFFDIGSKYAKLAAMIYHAGSQKKFKPIRPNLYNYDIQYNLRHQTKFESNFDVKVILDKAEDVEFGSEDVLSVDSIYYPGVLQALQNSDNTWYVVCGTVPPFPGTYRYYDNEGIAIVTKENGKLMLDNQPKGNDKVYKHELLRIHPRSGTYYGKDWQLIDSSPIGPTMFTCLFRVTNLKISQPDNKVIPTAPLFITVQSTISDWPQELVDRLDTYLTSSMGTQVRYHQLSQIEVPQHILCTALSVVQLWCTQNKYTCIVSEPTTPLIIINRAREIATNVNNVAPDRYGLLTWLRTQLTDITEKYVKELTTAHILPQYTRLYLALNPQLEINGVSQVTSPIIQIILTFLYAPCIFYLLSPLFNIKVFLFTISINNIIQLWQWLTYITWTVVPVSIYLFVYGVSNLQLTRIAFTVMVQSLIMIFPQAKVDIYLLSILIYTCCYRFNMRPFMQVEQLLNLEQSINGSVLDWTKMTVGLTMILYGLLSTGFILAVMYYSCKLFDGLQRIYLHWIELNNTNVNVRDPRQAVDLHNQIVSFKRKINGELHKTLYVFAIIQLVALALYLVTNFAWLDLIIIPCAALATYIYFQQQKISVCFGLSYLVFRLARMTNQSFSFLFPIFIDHEDYVEGTIVDLIIYVITIFSKLGRKSLTESRAQQIIDKYVEIKSNVTDKSIVVTKATAKKYYSDSSYNKTIIKTNTLHPKFLNPKNENPYTRLVKTRTNQGRGQKLKKRSQKISLPEQIPINGYYQREDFYVQPDIQLTHQLEESMKHVSSGKSSVTMTEANLQKVRSEIEEDQYNRISQTQKTVYSRQTYLSSNQTAVATSALAKAVAFFVRHSVRLVNIIPKSRNVHLPLLTTLLNSLGLEQLLIDCALPTFDDYLQSVEPKKRVAYINGYNYFMNKDSIDVRFGVMQKSDEKQIGTSKPRNIFNPSDSIKGVMGYVSHCLLKSIKQSKYNASFLPGSTPDYLEESLQSWINYSPITSVSTDCSSFDAHQSIELIDAIDHAYLRKALPILLDRLNIVGVYADQITKLALASQLPFTYSRGITGRIKGTVFSGHPLRTTLGNTLRMMIVNLYCLGGSLDIITGDHSSIRTGHMGDDQFTLFKKPDEMRSYQQRILELFTSDANDEAPFGLKFKEINVMSNMFKFTSKTFYCLPEVKGVKDLSKAQALGSNLIEDKQSYIQALSSIQGELENSQSTFGVCEVPSVLPSANKVVAIIQDYKMGVSARPYTHPQEMLLQVYHFPTDGQLSG